MDSQPESQSENQSGFVAVPPEHARHDFVLARSSEKKPGAREKQLCETCDVPFNDHAHRLTFLQKMIARHYGKDWKRCSFRQRQAFKTAAVAWMGAQLERKLKPFIDSVECRPQDAEA